MTAMEVTGVAQESLEDSPKDPAALHRRLTSRQLTMIGIGGAIGTGLFLGSTLAISHAGPSAVIAYVLCGLIALVISWALAEMVVVHPDAGAFGTIAHSYVGAWAGFVIRWTYWFGQVIAIGGEEVVAAGIYIQFWWPQVPLWIPVVAFSVVILGVNASMVSIFGTLEYWFSMIKVTAIAVFVILGVVLIFFGLPGQPAHGLSNLTSHGGFFPNGVSGLGLAMVFALFSYIGTEVVSVTAAESKNPRHDIPKAARQMVLRMGLFYVLAILVIVTVAPWTVAAQGGTLGSSLPFVRVFAAANIPAAAGIMNFVVITAALSSANTNLYVTTRMMHSLALHRLAPRWTGRLTRRGVPRNALVLSALGMAAATLLSVRQNSQAYLVIFGVALFAAIVVWILILVTHFVFRLRRTKLGLPDSPVRLLGAPVTSGVAAVFLTAVLLSTFFVPGLDPAWKFGIPFFLSCCWPFTRWCAAALKATRTC
ncbi:amino acid permease [Fodinicola feengrottensis]|uniref:amino acid permease n=1 Tax=Fodinicola feengrottensis TaxID=435914 RepID=UPI0024424E6F|nr:amino acid permease [Fodinicola feengrottensis]